MQRVLLTTVMVGLTGCGLTPERFIEKYVDIRCTNEANCRPDLFSATWGDNASCKAELNDAWATVIAEYESLDCSFDVPQAKSCLEAARNASCDTWESWRWFDTSCFRVWRCPTPFIDSGDTGTLVP